MRICAVHACHHVNNFLPAVWSPREPASIVRLRRHPPHTELSGGRSPVRFGPTARPRKRAPRKRPPTWWRQHHPPPRWCCRAWRPQRLQKPVAPHRAATGVKDVYGQVEQGIKSQKKFEPGNLQEEASMVVTRPENQIEGVSFSQLYNVAGKDVKKEGET